MKKAGVLFLVVINIMLLGASGYAPEGMLLFQKNYDSDVLRVGSKPNKDVLELRYYEEAVYRAALSEAERNGDALAEALDQWKNEKQRTLLGGILPHHLVASPMIARFFYVLKEELTEPDTPKTIVLLAPNHKRIGDRPLHTIGLDWRTPFGLLSADKTMVDDLLGTFRAGVNPRLFEEEHSISSLIPFVHGAFPKAEVVPLLIHGNMKRSECSDLAKFLSKKASDKASLILASVDFSHGLSPRKALERNNELRRIIEARDYDTLMGLDNTYLDAPPTLATFLMAMDNLSGQHSTKRTLADAEKAQGMMLEQGEASQYLKKPVSETTGYMTWLFFK